MDSSPHQAAYLRERIGWLVRLRWIAVAGCLLAIGVATWLGMLRDPVPAVLVALGLGSHNLHSWLRQRAATRYLWELEREIFRQLVFDLVALALLIHLGGGLKNPFVAFCAFHMAIGAMLLPHRGAIVLGVVATACFGGVVIAGLWLGPSASRLATFLELGRLVAAVLVMFGTIYFVQSVAGRHREAEALRREHERVAISRERLARVGEVSAGVAHAVRNPLHGLINCVDMLAARAAADATTRQILSLMEEALQRIDRVTRRLLVLTRDIPLERSECDVDDLIADALRLASPRARGSAARIQPELGGAGLAAIDSNRFTEAVVNVLDNAIDACRDGGTVRVRSGPDADREGHVCVEVADSGPGIPPADLERIFDPFFTTKAVGHGTGLGLAITRRTIEEHGGQVTVSSAPGKGTTVLLRLPRHSSGDLGGAA